MHAMHFLTCPLILAHAAALLSKSLQRGLRAMVSGEEGRPTNTTTTIVPNSNHTDCLGLIWLASFYLRFFVHIASPRTSAAVQPV